jgi:hypothetical protein
LALCGRLRVIPSWPATAAARRRSAWCRGANLQPTVGYNRAGLGPMHPGCLHEPAGLPGPAACRCCRRFDLGLLRRHCSGGAAGLVLFFSGVGTGNAGSRTNSGFCVRTATSEARREASSRRKKISASIVASCQPPLCISSYSHATVRMSVQNDARTAVPAQPCTCCTLAGRAAGDIIVLQDK